MKEKLKTAKTKKKPHVPPPSSAALFVSCHTNGTVFGFVNSSIRINCEKIKQKAKKIAETEQTTKDAINYRLISDSVATALNAARLREASRIPNQ